MTIVSGLRIIDSNTQTGITWWNWTGRNKSTISRELSRNTGKRGYRHKQANRLADERHQKKNKAIKLTDCVKNYISEKLKEY